MAPLDRFAPSKNGAAPVASSVPLSSADDLLAMFKRVEDAWAKAEQKLAETRVPVDVRVTVSVDPIEDEEREDEERIVGVSTSYLAYCRVKGSRRICYGETREYHS